METDVSFLDIAMSHVTEIRIVSGKTSLSKIIRRRCMAKIIEDECSVDMRLKPVYFAFATWFDVGSNLRRQCFAITKRFFGRPGEVCEKKRDRSCGSVKGTIRRCLYVFARRAGETGLAAGRIQRAASRRPPNARKALNRMAGGNRKASRLRAVVCVVAKD